MNLSLTCSRLCILIALQRKNNYINVLYKYLKQYNLSIVTLKIYFVKIFKYLQIVVSYSKSWFLIMLVL